MGLAGTEQQGTGVCGERGGPSLGKDKSSRTTWKEGSPGAGKEQGSFLGISDSLS